MDCICVSSSNLPGLRYQCSAFICTSWHSRAKSDRENDSIHLVTAAMRGKIVEHILALRFLNPTKLPQAVLRNRILSTTAFSISQGIVLRFDNFIRMKVSSKQRSLPPWRKCWLL